MEPGDSSLDKKKNNPASIRTFLFDEDYPAVRELWRSAGSGIHLGRSDEPTEILKKVARDGDLFLVAESEGRIVGAVMGGFDGRRGMIYHLAVEQSYRQQGLGAALMDELERRLAAKGCLRSYLLVLPDNEQAARFYEAHGWERMPLFAYGKDLDRKN